MNTARIDIEHYSDVLCVWAYIAQIRLDELRENFPDEVQVNYHFFSVFGDVAGKMAAQWAERGGLPAYAAHVQEVAAKFEHINLHPKVWLTNTPTSSLPAQLVLCGVKALRAADPEAFEPMLLEHTLGALRQAFFVAGVDVSRQSVVLDIAQSTGVEVKKLQTVLDDGTAHAYLAADFAAATKNAVRSSPTMIFNEGRQVLAGNVGYRVLEANIRELLRDAGDQQSWC